MTEWMHEHPVLVVVCFAILCVAVVEIVAILAGVR
jgi:hypothetical protein